MEEKNVISLEKQGEVSGRSLLDELLRDGAQRMLQTAIEQEVRAYVEEHQASVSADGRRLVVRNGHLPARAIQTGLGVGRSEQPRIADRRAGRKFRFIREVCSWKANPLEMRPIGKPRPQRRLEESSRTTVFLTFEAKPLRTGLPDRALPQGRRSPDARLLGGACREHKCSLLCSLFTSV